MEELNKGNIREKLMIIEENIKKNVNFAKKFNNEPEFAKWFELNYHFLGFDKIIKSNPKRFPDYIMEKDGEKIRVELETLSSRFILHKHDPCEVDLVICLRKNKELLVKTIEINLFEYKKEKDYTQMQIKKSIVKRLAKLKIHPQQPYSEVIDKLIRERGKNGRNNIS